MAAQRTVVVDEDLLPFRVEIPGRIADASGSNLGAIWRAWQAWFKTDEAEGLWRSGWEGDDEVFAISFSHLQTATAFKLKFC